MFPQNCKLEVSLSDTVCSDMLYFHCYTTALTSINLFLLNFISSIICSFANLLI